MLVQISSDILILFRMLNNNSSIIAWLNKILKLRNQFLLLLKMKNKLFKEFFSRSNRLSEPREFILNNHSRILIEPAAPISLWTSFREYSLSSDSSPHNNILISSSEDILITEIQRKLTTSSSVLMSIMLLRCSKQSSRESRKTQKLSTRMKTSLTIPKTSS